MDPFEDEPNDDYESEALKSGSNVLSKGGLASASFSLCNCYLTARSNTKRHHKGSAK